MELICGRKGERIHVGRRECAIDLPIIMKHEYPCIQIHLVVNAFFSPYNKKCIFCPLAIMRKLRSVFVENMA